MPLSSTHAARLALLALAPCLALASGCSSTPKPKDLTAQAAAPVLPPPATPAPSTLDPDAPGASAVRIDDRILGACHLERKQAYFDFDSAKVGADAAATLAQIAVCFATGPLAGRSLQLVGHADPRGETEYNFALGQSRADAVAGFLAQKGLEKARVASTSRGELDATGSDEPGWARDRHVDVLLAP